MLAGWQGGDGAARDRPGDGAWQAVASAGRFEVASAVADAVAAGRLDGAARHRWLAAEAALCRIAALALESLSSWHVAQPVLRDTALAWAAGFHADGRAAAAEARGFAAAAPTLPPEIGPWKAFLRATCASARAGEALGAVAFHAGLGSAPLCGPTHLDIVAAARVDAGHGYLARRGRRACGDDRQRDALLDAYAAAALAAGARRARDWYRALLGEVLDPPRAATASGGAGHGGTGPAGAGDDRLAGASGIFPTGGYA